MALSDYGEGYHRGLDEAREVTDAMVGRAAAKLEDLWSSTLRGGWTPDGRPLREAMRSVLNAALHEKGGRP